MTPVTPPSTMAGVPAAKQWHWYHPNTGYVEGVGAGLGGQEHIFYPAGEAEFMLPTWTFIPVAKPVASLKVTELAEAESAR